METKYMKNVSVVFCVSAGTKESLAFYTPMPQAVETEKKVNESLK
jgi:hypothetical protein